MDGNKAEISYKRVRKCREQIILWQKFNLVVKL